MNHEDKEAARVALTAPLDAWLAPIAWALYFVVLLVICQVWEWPGWTEKDSPVAAWAQAFGSVAAIVAGALAIRWQVRAGARAVEWQVRHQHAEQDRQRHLEEVKRLQLLWVMAYHCRVEMQHLKKSADLRDAPGVGVRKLNHMTHRVDALGRTGILEIPDADAVVAVQTIVGTYGDFLDGTKPQRGDITLVVPKVEPHANAAHENFMWAERMLRMILLRRGADIPDTRIYRINDVLYPPLTDSVSADEADGGPATV